MLSQDSHLNQYSNTIQCRLFAAKTQVFTNFSENFRSRSMKGGEKHFCVYVRVCCGVRLCVVFCVLGQWVSAIEVMNPINVFQQNAKIPIFAVRVVPCVFCLGVFDHRGSGTSLSDCVTGPKHLVARGWVLELGDVLSDEVYKCSCAWKIVFVWVSAIIHAFGIRFSYQIAA